LPTVMIYQSRRSTEEKRNVIGPVTEAIADAYGLRRDQIQVYFHESDAESWGKDGVLQTDTEANSTA